MNSASPPTFEKQPLSLPAWFRQRIPDMEQVRKLKGMFREGNLHTVCESAHCPNMGECWSKGVATFMILGDLCTRACRFCAVAAGNPLSVDENEPRQVAAAILKMRLRYVVVTSVARDDLPDEGAGHFVRTIAAIREISPATKIEVLIPDFSARAECLKAVVAAGPEVISHNIETVRRFSPIVRPQADYERSLNVLRTLKDLSGELLVKSSLMVGLGESLAEIEATMKDLIANGCDMLTIGQYLSPSREKRHLPVARYATPGEFDEYKRLGLGLGFKHVMSGPLVRSSYIAEEGYRECLEALNPRGA